MSDGLQSEAIQKVVQLALEGRTPQIIKLPERSGVYAIYDPHAKTITTRVREPGWHAQAFTDVSDLIRFINDRTSPSEKPFITANAAVFAGVDGITLVYDLADRRDTATMALTYTEPFAWLMTVAPKAMLSQADIVRTLRVLFRNCLPGGGRMIDILRSLKFNANGEAEGNIQHGRESLGKKITNAVTGMEAIPEEIQFEVRVWNEVPASIVSVSAALEVLPVEQRFRITPYPVEIENAKARAMNILEGIFAGSVNDDGIAFYRGTHNRRQQGNDEPF